MSAMDSTASLSEITMDQSSKVMDFTFIQPPELKAGYPVVNRDGLEFSLGLERGDLKHYYETPMNCTKLHSDMIQLFKKKMWTLLPSQEDLEGLLTLFTHNRASSTSLEDRVLFTLNFPPREYTYRLLPPRVTPADPESEIFHVGEKQYRYPYENLPFIKASIHPAFVMTSVNIYTLLTSEANPPVINSVAEDLIGRIMRLLHQAIPITWLDGTWDEYDHRGLVLVRDYPRQPRKKAHPRLEDGYVTPEERDAKADDPRRTRREKKMEKYIEEHNQQRSTKVAKGAALDLKAHQSATPPAPQVHKSEDVPKDQSGQTPTPHQDENTLAETKGKGVVRKRARRTNATPEPTEQQVRKRRRIRTRSASPTDSTTAAPTDPTTVAPTNPPPAALRRSTRTHKIPPKYT